MSWRPDYTNVPEATDFIRAAGDGVDDTFVGLYVTTASRDVDGYCHRQFGRCDTAEERSYTAVYDRRACLWRVDIDDLQDASSLVVKVNDVTTTNYRLEPVNALKKGKVYTQLVFTGAPFPCGAEYEVKATDRWGWLEIPGPVTLATLMQVHMLAIGRVSPYGLATQAAAEGGNVPRLSSRLHPSAVAALGAGWRRW